MYQQPKHEFGFWVWIPLLRSCYLKEMESLQSVPSIPLLLSMHPRIPLIEGSFDQPLLPMHDNHPRRNNHRALTVHQINSIKLIINIDLSLLLTLPSANILSFPDSFPFLGMLTFFLQLQLLLFCCLIVILILPLTHEFNQLTLLFAWMFDSMVVCSRCPYLLLPLLYSSEFHHPKDPNNIVNL